jgi:hypothetical protein
MYSLGLAQIYEWVMLVIQFVVPFVSPFLLSPNVIKEQQLNFFL